jgi:hypothetical protein
LGLGDVSSQSSPKELKFFKGMNVKQIFCGHDHNVALCGKFISFIFVKKMEKSMFGVTTSMDSSELEIWRIKTLQKSYY